MKKQTNKKSWLDKRLEKKAFRGAFENEAEKLSIGEQLVELRMKAGLTQAAVAKKVGTTASAISRYEIASYDRYEVGTLRKIAKACGGILKLSFISDTKAA